MADQRFFIPLGPFSADALAERVGARLSGADTFDLSIRDVAPLQRAGPDELTFFDNPRYAEAFQACRAGACLVAPRHAPHAPAGMILLLTDEPYKAYARIAQLFYPARSARPGRHASAVIEDSANVDPGAEIGPGAVIGAGAVIASGCRILANAVIDEGVVLGEGTVVGKGASISHAIIGRNCLFHAGVRIGEDGFGFAVDPGGHIKIPQLGRVLIGDNVEIGANSTVDRGAGPDTVVGDGCFIDNLVQIGHNVEIGAGSVLVAQTGIAGSTKLGAGVMVGGGAGISGHLTVGDGARIGAHAGVIRDVAPGTSVLGAPAVPATRFWRQVSTLARLVKTKDG